jgi:dUTP diphosphatase
MLAGMIAVDELPIRLLRPGARPPRRARAGDAGYDLHCIDGFALPAGGRRKVPTGVAIALPEAFCGLVVPRSGLATRDGVVPVLGLVDPNFRGELCVTLANTSTKAFDAAPGERIAQLLLVPFWAPALAIVDELPAAPDDRGELGWGSSGRV